MFKHILVAGQARIIEHPVTYIQKYNTGIFEISEDVNLLEVGQGDI